jgi:hemerythrin superfamily protein
MQVSRPRSQKQAERSSDEMSMEFDPIELLISQHREIDSLFEQMNEMNARAYRSKEKLAQIISQKLLLHTKIEEKIFYPRAKELMPDMVLESFEEHDMVKMGLKRLLATKGNDFSFKAKATVLKELIDHHVQEEEQEMFPQMREQIDEDDMKELGAKMMKEMERGEGGMSSRSRGGMERRSKSA